MRSQPVVAIVVLLLTAGAVRAASAQTLADVAKREADRRGAVRATGKVYTNTDLVSDFTTPTVPPPPPSAAAPKAEPSVQKTAGEEPVQVPVAAPGTEVERQASSDKGEDYWRNKAAAIRSAIAGQQAEIAAIETRLQSLAVSKSANDRRENELSSMLLAKAKADLISLEEEKARFEALAKAKNVPASWLR
jgi:hypothetical protein